MSARSIIRSTFSATRVTFALLLAVLMVLPDGVAFAATCPASTATWTLSGVPLPNITETFGAAVAPTSGGNFMYVIGGENWNGGSPIFPTNVYHKLVSAVASTTSGTWFSNPLWKGPAGVAVGFSRDLCGVVNNGYLYTVGGVFFDSTTNSFGNSTNQVWYNQIQSNGSLSSTWNSANPIPSGANGLQLHGAAVVTVGGNTYLYVIGGSTADHGDTTVSGHVTNAVHYAKFNSNGSLGTWDVKSLPPIPSPGKGVYKTCPVVHNGTIYVSGGEDESGSLDQVVYATPTSDGTFNNGNTWTTDTDATFTADAPQAVVYNDGIILMGGDQTGQGNDWATVLRGTVGAGGNVTWSETSISALPQPISRNAGATSGSWIFSLGGNHAGNDVNCVYFATAP